jgi:hypothetical protein
MLALGLAGLFREWLVVAVCVVVMAASARHGAQVVTGTVRRVSAHWRSMGAYGWLMTIVMTLVLAWLLVTRALYPGGGRDYYTHYFPYYIAALENHGLAPNDVWYHFYYSKGDGLFFLAMLLTDPMSHALVTFCFVAFAALAIASLAAKLAPGSLWPFCGSLLYLLYYAISMNRWGGGEWQKSHEMVAALFTLTAWAVCMHGTAQRGGAYIAMAAACVISIAIVNQPVGVLASACCGVLGAASVLGRDWKGARQLVLAAAAGFATVVAIFLLNFIMTGLATDQAFNLMLRFADFPKLDRWGVLPQIVMLAWLHDNLKLMAPPFGIDAFQELSDFMRLGLLWPFMVAPAIALAAWLASRLMAPGSRVPSGEFTVSFRIRVATRLALVVSALALLSLALGQEQNISYSRLSSFFVPLLVMLSVALAALFSARTVPSVSSWLLRSPLPLVSLLGSLVLWQISYGWAGSVTSATTKGLRLLSGADSFAEAYSQPLQPNWAGAYPFGAINPGTLAASRQLPPGTPIWSTYLDAYCMAPGCWVESVMSFKMSGRLDEIVAGSPEHAKSLLQEAGLNYFLFSSDYQLLDILPFSHLFEPEVIGRFLGIKWTDGHTYLLTWAGAGISPLTKDFLDAYAAKLNRPEGVWFRFNDLVRYLEPATESLRGTGASLASATPWRAPAPAGTIDVESATYGESCRSFVPPSPYINMFRPSNATGMIRDECRGKDHCDFKVDVSVIGDPVNGCGKDFSVRFRCNPGSPFRSQTLPAEANGKTVVLDCTATH